jgi:hypothetical protein
VNHPILTIVSAAAPATKGVGEITQRMRALTKQP